MGTTARTLLLLCALVTARSDAGAQQTDAPPNILLLFADDQRTDTIAAWGNPHIQTPHLDRLVADGFSFRRAYNLGSSGGAVCVPSRAMLHTGRAYFGMNMQSLGGHPTLGQLLGEAGYETFATGKWHNGRDSLARSFQGAHSVHLGGMCDHHDVSLHDLDDGVWSDGRKGEGHSSTLFADAAVGFLESYEGEAPFFLYAAFTAPHDPRDPPAEWREHYSARRPPLPANFRGQHGLDIGFMTVRDEQLAAWPRSPEVVRDQLAEYYGLISHLDAEVGRILSALAASGHAQDTLIVYAADHGLAVGSHGLLGKQSLYEHSARAPLIVSGPGIPRGASSTALVYLLDLFPTLLSRGGAASPDGILGRDLAPLWGGQREAVRESLFTAMGTTQRALTDGRWKLVRYPKIDHLQLFDLDSDPHELLNLAARPEQVQRVASLSRQLRAWQTEVGDALSWTADKIASGPIDLSGHARNPDRWQPEWIVDKYFDD